jgi:hypothetical protein
MTVGTWISRWWHEGNGSTEDLKAVEAELKLAIKRRTELSLREAAIGEHEADRAKELAERTLRIANEALKAIKRGD